MLNAASIVHTDNRLTHEGQILTTSFEPTWYWHFESLFWPEQIMRICELCERGDEEEGLTKGIEDAKQANHNIRKNKVSWHDNEELYSMLRGSLEEVNKQSGWDYNITAIEPIQYTVYYGDQNHYHWHTDTVVGEDLCKGGGGILNNTIRKISCSIQLTDPREYEGGEFELMVGDSTGSEDEFNVEPLSLPHFREKGSAMFFPSFSYHRVKPVTKGIRRSLVAWFRGPKWR